MRREKFTPKFRGFRQGFEKSDDPRNVRSIVNYYATFATPLLRGIPNMRTKPNLSLTIPSACDPSDAPSISATVLHPAARHR